MLPLLARNVICPLHERLLGRSTFRYVREMEESQWSSPDEVSELQRTKLHALLRHAGANIPFYRRRFDRVGIGVADEDPFASLARLPLLGKEEIRRSVPEMLWHDAPGGLFECNTGGSSGEPLNFYLGRRRQGYDQAARIRTHRWFGVDIGDREVFLWGSPIELAGTDRVKQLRDALFNQRLLNAFNMSPGRMDGYLDMLERFRPACLFGYPSSLALLARHARSRNRFIDTAALRALFVTGEVCHGDDRQAIAEYFDAPVADGYGSREAGFIAHECPAGSIHLSAENVVVEIFDNGRPAPVGHVGEIVVTHLDAYAMPFIRYRTGDVGRLKAGRCRCGRGLPMMDIVHGRTTDFLYLPDGSIKHALSIIYPLRAMPGVGRFRVTQHEDYSVTVDVVRDDSRERITRETVERGVRPVFEGQVAIEVQLVDRIAGPSSGKNRHVISRAVPARTSTPQEVTADV